jgi:hypothetical protein
VLTPRPLHPGFPPGLKECGAQGLQLYLDRHYMLSAIGLLSEIEPEAARVLLEDDLEALRDALLRKGCHVAGE